MEALVKEDLSCSRIDVDVQLIEDAKLFLEQTDVQIEQNAKIFSLLANDARLKIIYLFLKYERMCVCDLSDILGMKQSPISQHLRKLKDGGLLKNKREGMTVFYFLNEDTREILKRIIAEKQYRSE